MPFVSIGLLCLGFMDVIYKGGLVTYQAISYGSGSGSQKLKVNYREKRNRKTCERRNRPKSQRPHLKEKKHVMYTLRV